MKITIGGKEYEASPLRLKHLRKIQTMLEDNTSPRKITFADVDKYVPFIFDSISYMNPGFKEEELGEMSIDEFLQAWSTLTNSSGIRIVSKGETKPAEVLTSSESTDALPSAAAGPILQ